MSKKTHTKVAKYLKEQPPQQELSGMRLGKLRVDIKKYIAPEMKEIDKLVKKIMQ